MLNEFKIEIFVAEQYTSSMGGVMIQWRTQASFFRLTKYSTVWLKLGANRQRQWEECYV